MHGRTAVVLRVVSAALASPLNLRLGGLALTASAAVGSWALAGLASGAYLALVTVDLASPEFRARALAGERPREGS